MIFDPMNRAGWYLYRVSIVQPRGNCRTTTLPGFVKARGISEAIRKVRDADRAAGRIGRRYKARAATAEEYSRYREGLNNE